MAFTIKTTKNSGFKRVPEGRQDLLITKVELVPSGKPQKAIFHYEHDSGATMRESFSFSNKVAVEILGKRCDLLYNSEIPEGTEIDATDLPNMFVGKITTAEIKHNESNGKTYANIKYVESFRDSENAVVVDDEDDDL